MAEVADQGSVGLAHLGADAFAHGVFGLFGVERDHAHLRTPVITCGPPGMLPRKSKARPCTGSAWRVTTGSPSASSCDSRRRLACSSLRHSVAVALDRQVGDGARGAARQAETGRQPLGGERSRRRRRAAPAPSSCRPRGRQEVVAAAPGLAAGVAEDGEGIGLGVVVGRPARAAPTPRRSVT